MLPERYKHVAKAFYGSPWAILPEKLLEIRSLLETKLRGEGPSAEEVQALTAQAGPRPQRQVTGTVAVLPLFGVVSQRMGMMAEFSGGTSTEQFGAAFDQLVADRMVKAIVINIDSPGGSVFGTQELAQKILDARGEKKVIAISNSLAASAAYWIGAAAGEFVVTPSGQVGSIGVFAAHEDISRLEEASGVKTTLISAGKYKTEGNPYEPLTEDGRAAMQAMVDGYYEAFVAGVAKGRGVRPAAVREGFGQGRAVGAEEAKRLGMVDRIATLEQVLDKLGVPRANGSPASAETPFRRLDAELRLADLE